MKRNLFPGQMIPVMDDTEVDFGKQLTLDFKSITDINADFARMARKGNIAAFFVRVKYTARIPAGGAADRYNYRTQRGCTAFASIEQPGVERLLWEGEQPLSKLHHVSMMVNLPAVALARYVPGELGEFPDELIAPQDSNVFAASGAHEAVKAAMAWDAFVGPAVCIQSGGAAVDQDISDVYAIVPCIVSREPGNDTLPAHYFSNEQNSVKLRFRILAPGLAANPGPWAPGTAPVGTTATVAVFAFMVGDRVEKDAPTVGLPWCFREQERPGPEIEMDAARSYRAVGIFPMYDSDTTDDGVRIYYEPHDWPEYLDTECRWRTRVGADWRDDFPLCISSGGGPNIRHVLNLWNQTAARGWEVGTPYDSIAPAIFPVSSARAHSVISDTIAGSLAWNVLGDGSLASRGWENFIGRHSFSPFFPLALTSYVDKSFPGFGDRKSGCNPRIRLTPDTRPTNLVSEIFTNPEMQAVVLAKDTGISMCGCPNNDGQKPKPIFLPALDNLSSPAAKDNAEMVPLVAITKASPADAAKLKEATPEVSKIVTPG